MRSVGSGPPAVDAIRGGKRGPGAVLLAIALSMILAAGCVRGTREKTEVPLPPDERETRQAAREPEAEADGEGAPSPARLPDVPAEIPTRQVAEEKPPMPETKAAEEAPAGIPAAPSAAEGAAAPEAASPEEPPVAEKRETGPAAAENGERKTAGGTALPAPVPARANAQPNGPAWARGNEELVFRVEFLGMTMGYARFTFKGKKRIDGREAYHLTVRAWTSDVLSVIYPINDTIDYYLDANTLAPLRQEYTKYGKDKKDDIAFYDQEKGKIVYRYKHNGEIRKQVEVPPGIHDPVSVAYYFRARDLGMESRPRNVYAGRKLWKISTKTLGTEKVETSGGPVDAVVVQPIIRQDDRQENKGDMKLWMSNDARHVPVKIYAKFRKIRTWTLTAVLISGREGG